MTRIKRPLQKSKNDMQLLRQQLYLISKQPEIWSASSILDFEL